MFEILNFHLYDCFVSMFRIFSTVRVVESRRMAMDSTLSSWQTYLPSMSSLIVWWWIEYTLDLFLLENDATSHDLQSWKRMSVHFLTYCFLATELITISELISDIWDMKLILIWHCRDFLCRISLKLIWLTAIQKATKIWIDMTWFYAVSN